MKKRVALRRQKRKKAKGVERTEQLVPGARTVEEGVPGGSEKEKEKGKGTPPTAPPPSLARPLSNLAAWVQGWGVGRRRTLVYLNSLASDVGGGKKPRDPNQKGWMFHDISSGSGVGKNRK